MKSALFPYSAQNVTWVKWSSFFFSPTYGLHYSIPGLLTEWCATLFPMTDSLLHKSLASYNFETLRSLEAMYPAIKLSLTKLPLLSVLAAGHGQSWHSQFCTPGGSSEMSGATWKRYEGDTWLWQVTRAIGTRFSALYGNYRNSLSILHPGEDPFHKLWTLVSHSQL